MYIPGYFLKDTKQQEHERAMAQHTMSQTMRTKEDSPPLVELTQGPDGIYSPKVSAD